MSDLSSIEGRRELISFKVGGQEFCVDIMSVVEIRGWSQPTPLPHAPDYIRGMVNLRGTVLPIVDLGARLGLGAADPTARHAIIVARIAGNSVGLMVEAVSDILTITNDVVQPTPEVGCETVKSLVPGILPMDGRMVSLMNVDAILPDAAMAA
jgi:purine-binding chemotaxis protein CheW